ncbi:MAG: ribosome maturation factor RimP [Rhodospirillales bacterium]|nr:ribosome maturation factor RimP [Rhodospirillales bacterium]
MDQAGRVAEIVAPTLDAMGYDLVRVQLAGNRNVTLQIMADRKDEAAMTVDDCAAISREVSALLDVEDPVQGAYSLEVSSPGIDRPLVTPRDFERFAGFDAKLETRTAIDGRKRFRGKLVGVDGGRIRLRTDAGDVDLDFEDIRTAKLLLTDELIEAASRANM